MTTPPADRPRGGERRRLLLETDGGSRGNPGPAGYGAVVRAADGTVLAERGDYLGVTTNNVAEYTGLVEGLRVVHHLDPDALVEVRADSKLLVEQMSGRWQIKHEDMRRLAREARAAFPPERVRYTWIPRAQNSAADALANAAMDRRGAVGRTIPTGGAAEDAGVADGAGEADHAGRADGTGSAGGSGPVAASRGSVAGRGSVAAGRGSAPGGPGDVAVSPTPPRALGATLLPGTGDPVTVVLVRHGQTDATLARTYAGGDGPGAPLNARGRTEAARAADLVHRIGAEAWPDLPRPSAILSSSMLRAQQTAAAVARRLGVRAEVDDAFAECRFGQWEGLTAVEIAQRWPGQPFGWLQDASVPAAGGESMADVAARVRAAVERLVAQHAGRTVVVATHTVTIRAGVGGLVGLDPAAWSRLRVPPASLTILRLWPDSHELTALACPSEL